ncbi:MAG: hypothetical protein Q7R47_03620 [Candidatus Diapherotrites archaeon]|nr:hypothetical protein [Candidatus Diapherotrites archaeon]
MGIYDSFPMLDLDMDQAKKLATVVAGIVVIALLGFVIVSQQNTGFGVFGFLQPNPISSQLEGPINLSLGADGLPVKTSTSLVITLQNPTNKPVYDAVVIVKPSDNQAILVYPPSKTIPILDNSRQIQFTLRPNPIQPALSGKYDIEVQAFLDGKIYTQHVELEVKTNEP